MYDMHDNVQLLLPDFEFAIPDHPAAPPLPQAPALRVLELRFPDVPLFPRQIPHWRGAVIESAGHGNDIFHNHLPEAGAVHYRPALVQYRCKGGQAALWGMNDGADAIADWYARAPEHLRIDGHRHSLRRATLERYCFPLRQSAGWRRYRLHDYLALNPDNYRRWLAEPRLVARAELLEKALTAQLLAFCQAAGWWLTERLEAELLEIHGYKQVKYHGVTLLAFELSYRCNLDLPEGIALGKAVSHGFGVQWNAPHAGG